MALPLPDQYNFATNQPVFRSRVAAALMGQAIISTAAPANPNADTQAHRLQFASEVITNVARHLDPVAWFVTTRPTLNNVDQLTDDAVIIGIITQQAFDLIALQLVTPPVP